MFWRTSWRSACVLQAGKPIASHARPRSHISCSSGSSGAGPTSTPGLCQAGGAASVGPGPARRVNAGPECPPTRPAQMPPHAALGIPIDRSSSLHLNFYDPNSSFLPSCRLSHHVKTIEVLSFSKLSFRQEPFFPSLRESLRRPQPRVKTCNQQGTASSPLLHLQPSSLLASARPTKAHAINHCQLSTPATSTLRRPSNPIRPLHVSNIHLALLRAQITAVTPIA